MRYGSVETAPRKINKKKYEEKLNVLDICVPVTISMFGHLNFLCNTISSKCGESVLFSCISAACVSFNM